MTRRNILTLTLTILLAIVSVALLLVSPQRRQISAADSDPPDQIVHYSTLMGKEFYDRAYAQMPITDNSQLTTKNSIAGGTVNHHLLAAPLDAQFFEGLAAQKPQRIILIGPDHLSRGHQPITITASVWATPYGDLTTDTALVSKLVSNKVATIEESPFDYEFSVGGLVPFIRRSLPQAKTTTIIVRSDATEEQLLNLSNALPRDNDTIVVASIDFSHYLPSRAAEFHDLTNRAIIDAFDYSNFDKLEIDSVPTLRVLMKYLELRGAYSAMLVANTDSAKITGKLETQETTSYLDQYFSIGEKTPFNVKTSLYLGSIKKIVSPEDRFRRGYMSVDDGSTLPATLKKPDLAVGVARYSDKTVYYLFPTSVEKGTRRLMTAAEERAYFQQNNIDSAIITISN